MLFSFHLEAISSVLQSGASRADDFRMRLFHDKAVNVLTLIVGRIWPSASTRHLKYAIKIYT